MASHKFVLWAVDLQADFMNPGGTLYVPGAEKLLPNIRRLIGAAREGKAFLVAHGCFHTKDDPEFADFPPHCIHGTSGAEFIPEVLTGESARVRNHRDDRLPEDFTQHRQLLLEKQTLDIFETHHANTLVERLGRDPQFFVFGVATEYCVRLAAKGLLERGRRVAVVTDAIETLNAEEGKRTISELKSLGAELVTTEEALHRINSEPAHPQAVVRIHK
jgi:nicotinamidase/pyrazinamidase